MRALQKRAPAPLNRVPGPERAVLKGEAVTRSVDTRPFAPFEWRLASRYLRPRRTEGFISVTAGFSIAGILIGVAALIAVTSVMNGFRQELFAKSMGLNGHAAAVKIGEPFTDYDAAAERVAKAPGVRAALPVIEGQVLISGASGGFGGWARGMTEKSLRAMPLVADNIVGGTLENFDNQPGVAIGIGIANALGINVGNTITIVSPKGAATPFGVTPRVKSYPVSAIFELGHSGFDKSVLFMPLGEAQRYFNKKDEVDLLEIFVTNPDQIDTAAIRAAGGDQMSVSDWRQRDPLYANVMVVERNVMFVILSLIVIVAIFNIIAGLLMLVKDKGRDIAVLRTMGATKGAIMRVFLITGASIGAVGALLGLILGLIISWNIESVRQGLSWLFGVELYPAQVYFLSKMRADINPVEVAVIVTTAFVLAVLATLYPSWRASRMDPVDALRYE
jgi:lipoprotein-releasing system permease protein